MNTKRIEKRLILKRSIKKKLNKLLLSVIVLLIGMIAVKKNPELKTQIREQVYEKSIPFLKIKEKYKKYFGNFLSITSNEKTQAVFQENNIFQNKKKYQNGVLIKTEKNEKIPTIESGIIVFIGEKEKLGNTIIVEQIDGVDTMYSNISSNNKKVYDYVEKGDIIGESIQKKIYLSFQKDGKYLDYEKYL